MCLSEIKIKLRKKQPSTQAAKLELRRYAIRAFQVNRNEPKSSSKCQQVSKQPRVKTASETQTLINAILNHNILKSHCGQAEQ